MNSPSPLIPQGSLLEQKAKNKSHLHIAVLIVLVHVVFLGGLLMQGCKQDDKGALEEGQLAETNKPALPPETDDYYTRLDTNLFGKGGQNQESESTNLSPSPPRPRVPTNEYAGMETGTPAGVTNFEATQENSPSSPATNEEPASPEVTQDSREHIVKRGDSFYSIGKQYGVSARAMIRANPQIDPSRLQIGQKVQVPPAPEKQSAPAEEEGEYYVVRPGDTLTRIAGEHDTTVKALKQANQLSGDRINVGQKLKIPESDTGE